MGFDVFLVVGVSFVSEYGIVAEESFNNWTQLGELFL